MHHCRQCSNSRVRHDYGTSLYENAIRESYDLVVAAVLRDSMCRVIAALRGRLVCCIPCVRLSGLY